MAQREIEAIFFDFDGTLAATVSDVIASWRAALDICGVSCPELVERFRIGPPVEVQVRRLLPDCRDEELLKRLQETFKKHYDYSDFATTTAYDCALMLCKELAARGKKLYIATNKRWYSTRALTVKLGFMPWISGIYSPDIVPGMHMTKPEFLSLAVRISGVDPSRCLMVGDTELDIEAGKAAGCASCAVTWGYGEADKVAAANPDCYMHAATVVADFDRFFC